MKKEFLLAVLLVTGIAGCEQKPKYTIEGEAVSEEMYFAYQDSIVEVERTLAELRYKQEQRKKGFYEATDTIFFGDLRFLLSNVEKVKESDMKNNPLGNRFPSIPSMMSGGVNTQIIKIDCEVTNTSDTDVLALPYIFYKTVGVRRKKNGITSVRMSSPEEKVLESMGSRFVIDLENESILSSYKILPGENKHVSYYSYNPISKADQIRLSYGGRVDNGVFTLHTEVGEVPFAAVFQSFVLSKEEITLPEEYLEKEVYIDLLNLLHPETQD